MFDGKIFGINKLKSRREVEYEEEPNIMRKGHFQSNENEIKYISIFDLHPFKDHPFKVVDDNAMSALIDSVKENGILSPLIVRYDFDEEGYEILSGHRRHHAATEANIRYVPCIVVNYLAEEATLCVIDSNIHRKGLLPSEKAKSVSIKYDILLKRRQEDPALCEGETTREVIAKEFGMSPSAVNYCRRLYDLGDRLMDLVDAKKLQEKLAATKVYCLKPETREMVASRIEERGTRFSAGCLDRILEEDASWLLTQERFDEIVDEYETKGRDKEEKHTPFFLPSDRIRNYFPEDYTAEQIEKELYMLLLRYYPVIDDAELTDTTTAGSDAVCG